MFVLGWALALWGTGSNAASALLFAFVWTVLIVAAILTLLYLRARRRFARQLAPGLVLESEFGVNVVVLRGPETESRLTFSGLDRVQPSGDWVLLRQRRSRMTSCWPAALFPPTELAGYGAVAAGPGERPAVGSLAACASSPSADRWLTVVRRTVLAVVSAPFLVAIAMTLVDSYRRRGKRRAVSFPTEPPATVPVGEGEVTTYTFGTDLYAAMIAAIEGAQRQILFETYIWKGDEVGQRFKTALCGRRGPGRRGLLHLRRLREPRRPAHASSGSRRR